MARGLFDLFKPKFSKRFSELGIEMKSAFNQYHEEVIQRKFPSDENVYNVSDSVFEKFLLEIKKN